MRIEIELLRRVVAAPADRGPRLVYADWLEEQGDVASVQRAEFLRLSAEDHAPPARLAELAATLDPQWLSLVSRLRVENCTPKDGPPRAPPVPFDVLCQQAWESLEITRDPGVRHCSTCQRNVYYCSSIVDARQRASAGQCISLDLGISRSENDLEGRRHWLGRPSRETIADESARMTPDSVSLARYRQRVARLRGVLLLELERYAVAAGRSMREVAFEGESAPRLISPENGCLTYRIGADGLADEPNLIVEVAPSLHGESRWYRHADAEVWCWENGALRVVSRGDVRKDGDSASEVAPGIDLAHVACALARAEAESPWSDAAADAARGAEHPDEQASHRALVLALEDTRPEVRARSAWALGMLRAQDVSVAAALVRALCDGDATTRARAAWSLGQVRHVFDAPAAVAALIAAFGDVSADVRAAAAGSVGALSLGADRALNPLVLLLEDAEPEVRRSAAMAILELDWRDVERDDDSPPKLDALGGELLPATARATLDLDVEVRRFACRILGRFGRSHSDAVSALVARLQDDAPSVRGEAAHRLGAADALDCVPALIEALQDREPTVRAEAAWALGYKGESAAPAVPALAALLADPSADVRHAVLDALPQLGSASDATIPALIAALSSPDGDGAATALYRRGVRSPTAVEALIRCLAGAEADARRHAADTLGRIAWSVTTDAARGDPATASVREHVDRALGALVRALSDPDVDERAAQALQRAGLAAVPVLLRVVGTSHAPNRLRAIAVLGRIGRHISSVVDELVGLKASPIAEVRDAVAHAMASIEAHGRTPGFADEDE